MCAVEQFRRVEREEPVEVGLGDAMPGEDLRRGVEIGTTGEVGEHLRLEPGQAQEGGAVCRAREATGVEQGEVDVPHEQPHWDRYSSTVATLVVMASVTPGRTSALMTTLTRGAFAATASTARFTTAITSSHSPSTVVNIASVRLGRPDSRTTRTASATRSPTDSPVPNGVTENATSTVNPLQTAAGRRRSTPPSAWSWVPG